MALKISPTTNTIIPEQLLYPRRQSTEERNNNIIRRHKDLIATAAEDLGDNGPRNIVWWRSFFIVSSVRYV